MSSILFDTYIPKYFVFVRLVVYFYFLLLSSIFRSVARLIFLCLFWLQILNNTYQLFFTISSSFFDFIRTDTSYMRMLSFFFYYFSPLKSTVILEDKEHLCFTDLSIFIFFMKCQFFYIFHLAFLYSCLITFFIFSAISSLFRKF